MRKERDKQVNVDSDTHIEEKPRLGLYKYFDIPEGIIHTLTLNPDGKDNRGLNYDKQWLCEDFEDAIKFMRDRLNTMLRCIDARNSVEGGGK